MIAYYNCLQHAGMKGLLWENRHKYYHEHCSTLDPILQVVEYYSRWKTPGILQINHQYYKREMQCCNNWTVSKWVAASISSTNIFWKKSIHNITINTADMSQTVTNSQYLQINTPSFNINSNKLNLFLTHSLVLSHQHFKYNKSLHEVRKFNYNAVQNFNCHRMLTSWCITL
jgi:hypothetical protein